jgi:hypothetical protein
MYRSPATSDEVSPQWEAALDQNLPLNEPIHQLIFNPEFPSVESHHPASALCLTDRRWLIGLAESEGVTVESATFDETLLVELTIILFHGKVKIDFTKKRRTSVDCPYFNVLAVASVTADRFIRLALLIGGISVCGSIPVTSAVEPSCV